MTIARLRAIASRAVEILAAANPESGGIYCRMRRRFPAEPENLKGRWVLVFPLMWKQATGAGTRGSDVFDYTMTFATMEVLPFSLPNIEGDEGAEEAVEEWLNEREDWVETEICERFGNERSASDLWGAGFELVIPQEGPEMRDVILADKLDEKRMYWCEVDFVFREN